MTKLAGGCSCGTIRFELSEPPIWVLACHCNACKKRTGSNYGLSAVCDSTTVETFTGDTKTYSRGGDSGNEVHYEFCPNCATTIRWHVELVPNRQVFAVGAFDKPEELEVIAEMYTDDALPGAKLGYDLSCPKAPDDAMRQAMIERASSSR